MNPSPTSSSLFPSNSNNTSSFLTVLGMLAVVIVCGGAWFFHGLSEQKEYTPPDHLELTTQPVPLSRQVLVLVDDHPGSAYFDSIQSEVRELASGLTEEQQICLFQVVTDQPVMPQVPWCSDQIKTSWWVLPEIKPAPYAHKAEEQAYTQARVKLEAELADNLGRAQETWAANRVVRWQQVDSLLGQFPSQSYRSLADSLIRLMEVRTLTGQQPTEVVIYSPLVDTLYGQTVSRQVSLAGADVRIRVMTSEGEVGLTRAVKEWGPWFNSGHPAKLGWSILEPTEPANLRATSARLVAPSNATILPPVVPKPRVADRTNVIQGQPVTGDATSVIQWE